MENKYLYLLAAVALCVFLLYSELRRTNRERLFLRIIAVIALAGGLLGMLLPLSYTVVKNRNPAQLNLLTSGAILTNLKDSAWFTLDSNVLKQAGPHRPGYIADLGYYLATHPDIQTIHVKGNGLPAVRLRAIDGYNYQFDAAPVPIGIVNCSWPLQIRESSLLRVQGKYHNGDKPVRLYLEGLGTRLDSMSIAAGELQHFTLSTLPKQVGKSVYTLIAMDGKDTLAEEKIPFEVKAAPKINILILSSFPDFEYKFLKNWLYENQYPVVFRSRISKDKFTSEQLNTTVLNISAIMPATLGKFDLVIADDEELSKMDPNAITAFRTAVSSGLGMLVRLNDSKPLSPFAAAFRYSAQADSSAGALVLHMDKSAAAMHPLPQVEPFFVLPQESDRVMISDVQSRVLLGAQLYGLGRIAVSTVSSTYNWVLHSEMKDYSTFWSAVIASTARKQEEPFRWTILPEKIIAGEEAGLIYDSNTADSAAVLASGQSVSPQHHTDLPYRWKNTFWPQHTGWNRFKAGHDADSFYVFEGTAWLPLRYTEMVRINTLRSAQSQHTLQKQVFPPGNIKEEVSRWWFFALFLLAAGFLWFETKLL